VTTDEPQLDTTSKVGVSIKFDKNTYEVDEKVTPGKYNVVYEGETFNGLVISSFNREGFKEKSYATSKGSIRGNHSGGSLGAFNQDNSGYSMLGNKFGEAGTYNYEVYIYDCDVVGAEMKKDCSGIKLQDAAYVIKGNKALAYDKVSLTVTEAKKPEVVKDTPAPAPEPEIVKETGPKNCGSDVSCFNARTTGCQLTKVNTSLNAVALGALALDYNYTIENKGEVGGKCKLTVLVNSASVKYTDEYRQDAIAEGTMTAEQMDEYEVQAQTEYDSYVGVVSTCNLASSNVAGFVNAIKNNDVMGMAGYVQEGGCDKEFFAL